ncbi:MAG TPA: rhodanese-like domain-containing protein [Dissulfurispiraceae bacterium]|nr:rhodanese-like domain-containing protein [Dissulfurispiraceae bacterium]
MSMKRIMITVLAATFILGITGNVLAIGTKDLDNEKIAVNFQREVERGGYKVVTTQELKSWIDQKKDMLIVDTMPFEDSYKKAHIPAALNLVFPIPEMASIDDKTKDDLVKMLGPNKDRVVVFYCGFTQCTRSHNAAMWAVKLGYKNVYRYPGGIKAWDQADYQVEQAK